MIRKTIKRFRDILEKFIDKTSDHGRSVLSQNAPVGLNIYSNSEILAAKEDHEGQSDALNKQAKRIWIDVGAHHGEKTLETAKTDKNLIVYAFEPNLKAAEKLFGEEDNFIVVPMAVSERNGFSSFFINTFPKASSLLAFNPEGLNQWEGKEQLGVEKRVMVPTIRIDSFLNIMGIDTVDMMKIDAQGGDFSVILSSGDRLEDIHKIILEVAVTPVQLYSGAANKSEVVDFLKRKGFVYTETETQSYGQEENLTFVRPKV
jgi:FkbM family methyltransferase